MTKTVKMKKNLYAICGNCRKSKNLKISYIFEKTFFLLLAVSMRMKMKKYLKKRN